MRILHLSDIQLEIRRNSQRYDEYADPLGTVIAAVKADPTISKITITGDLFEFCSVTDTERVMFIEFVHELEAIPHVEEVVITSGNHDLKQRFNDIQISGVPVIEASVMDSLRKTFTKSTKVLILTTSGFFPSVSTPGLNWGVWAHEHKFDGQLDKYNPWTNTDQDPKSVIELYHDNFAGALSFNGQIQKGCDEEGDGFNLFKAQTILAGHIHNPQQVVSSTGQRFTYASSLVMRNFGEGDYYMNDKRTVEGNSKHGYYIHDIDENNNFSTINSIFVPVDPHTSRTTINIDKNFDWEMINSFRLLGTSKTKNLIRLNVIGNEAKYHEHSAELITILRAQAVNVEISIEIDSSSIFSDTTEQLDMELDKLVSEQQILDIAIPYIKRRIRSTKRIMEEDKEQAENTTIEMFTTQLAKIRKTVDRNNISFKSLSLSNFMSFEDNVSIDFSALKSLVKLSGTNGIGKTNIIKAIKWIVDDVIDSSQARNTTNQNAIDVFNDKRMDCNVVDSNFVFTNNGTLYTLTKTIERTFKTRSTDVTIHNWKEHLKSVQISKTLTIKTLESENILTDLDVIQTELKSIFGTVSDLEVLLFTNATLLDRLVKTNPDQLAEQVMYHLGLRYFSDMAADYDNLREEKLKSLSKPSSTIDALVIQKTDLTTAQTDGGVLKETLTSTKAGLDAELLIHNTQINDLRTKLHQITDTVETIDQKIKTTTDNITTKQQEYLNSLVEIETLTKSIDVIQNDFDTRIEAEISSKQPLQTEIDNASHAVTLLVGELETIKAVTINLGTELKAKLQKDIDTKYSEKTATLNTSLQTNETAKNELQTELKGIKHSLELKISTDKQTATTLLDNLNGELTTTNKDLVTNNQMLNLYKTSTKCKECNQDLTGDALQEIQTRISERETTITDLTTKVQTLTESAENAKVGLGVSMFTDTENYISTQLKTDQADKIKTLQDYITTIAGIKTELETLQTEKTSEESKISEQVRADPGVLESIGKMTTKGTELETAKQAVVTVTEKNTAAITAIDSKIVVIRTEKSLYEGNKTKLITLKEDSGKLTATVDLFNIQLETYKSDRLKVEANVNTNNQISDLVTKASFVQTNIDTTSQELYNIVLKMETAKNSLTRIETDIKDLIAYRIMDASLAIYKTFISKTGLNKLIFEAVSKKLNVHMNDLLQDSPYKLAFIDGVLHLIDSKNPDEPVTRTAPALSGMQIILGGLSLFYVLRNASLGTRFDSVFIDEISGPLNDGKDLTYQAIDYKELLVKMIAKMRDTSKVFIVDHVLDFYDGSVLEVYPSTYGANIKEIIVPQA